MQQVVQCPQCSTQLRVPDTFAPGSQVKCPKCQNPFAIPAPAGAVAAAPAAISASPSPMDGGYKEPPPPGSSEPPDFTLSSEYTVDLGAMFNEIGKHYGAILGPMIGFMFVSGAILIPVYVVAILPSLIPVLGSLIAGMLYSTVLPHLTAGSYYVMLRQMRGQPWAFGDFFAGFRQWVPLFIVGALTQVASWGCFLPVSLISVAMQFMVDQRNPDSGTMVMLALGLMFVFGAIGLVAYMWVFFKFFLLAPYLIIDRKVDAMQAIHGNAALCKGHMLWWFLTSLIAGLIGGIGVLACGIGALFTMPIFYILLTALYRQVIREAPPAGAAAA